MSSTQARLEQVNNGLFVGPHAIATVVGPICVDLGSPFLTFLSKRGDFIIHLLPFIHCSHVKCISVSTVENIQQD